MFTGIVEGLGRVSSLVRQPSGARLKVELCASLDADCQVGASLAINGCCLTVVKLQERTVEFDVVPESLARTNLGLLAVGHQVNLERPLAANGRLGGHFVQGHIDCVARVARIDRADEWVTMWFDLPSAFARYLVPKGSVAVDGVSLTVVETLPEAFSVALIPHTLANTTLGQRGVSDPVNIETDILGRYVWKFLEAARSTA
jgi:riboflavin synthase